MNSLFFNTLKVRAFGAARTGAFSGNGSKFFSSNNIISNGQVGQQLEQIAKVKTMRPRSPFYIYQPQLTSILSIFHRVSGVGLGLGFYGLVIAYPIFNLKSHKVVEYLETVPKSLKVAAKFIIAFPFMFHNFNGIRHLVWDTASSLTVKGVYTSGYITLASSVVSSLALASI